MSQEPLSIESILSTNVDRSTHTAHPITKLSDLTGRLLLATDTRVDPNTENALLEACRYGLLGMVKMLLGRKEPPIDPGRDDSAALALAAMEGHVKVVRVLLADGRVDPGSQESLCLRKSCAEGHIEVVKELLATGEQVDPSSHDSQALRKAAERGHLAIVEALMRDGRVVVNARSDAALRGAARAGHASIVSRLLQEEGVNPSAHFNYALQQASIHGHRDVVAALLRHPGIDPCDGDEENGGGSFVSACQGGWTEVVQLFLADGRVDPCAGGLEALVMACINGHRDVVACLMQDTRVALSASLSHTLQHILPMIESPEVQEYINTMDTVMTSSYCE